MRAIIKSDLNNYFGGNTRTNYMNQGQELLPNDCLTAVNGLFTLIYQPDGNLVMYDWMGASYWATNTAGHSAGRVAYQTDGNFCVYDASGTYVWGTMVYNYGAGILNLQNNGNLVVYKSPSNDVAWQAGVTPSVPTLTRNIMYSGDFLNPGDMLVSPNKYYRLVYQTDGNLVLYDSSNNALWATNTNGSTLGKTVMQLDGNLCINASDGVKWCFSPLPSAITANSHLTLQDDGNLVVYTQDNSQVKWATNTSRAVPSSPPMAITTTAQCGVVAVANGGAAAASLCGGVFSGISGCGGVLSGLGACGVVYSGASFCGAVANGVSACAADVSTIGICGVVAAAAGAAVVSITGVGGCGAVAAIVGLCGAVASGAGATVVGASGAATCGAVACAAAACGADVNGTGACVEAKGTGVCGANANGAQGVGVCGAQVGFCGLVACVALPIGGNW